MGEILQGRVSPEGLVVRSWPEHGAFDVLGGEPALTVLPNLLVSGIVTVLVGTWLAVWSVTRTLATAWPWALCAGVVGYLGLVPGALILQALWGSPPPAVVYGLIVLAFGGMVLALLAARASERLRAWCDASPAAGAYGGSNQVPLD